MTICSHRGSGQLWLSMSLSTRNRPADGILSLPHRTHAHGRLPYLASTAEIALPDAAQRLVESLEHFQID